MFQVRDDCGSEVRTPCVGRYLSINF